MSGTALLRFLLVATLSAFLLPLGACGDIVIPDDDVTADATGTGDADGTADTGGGAAVSCVEYCAQLDESCGTVSEPPYVSTAVCKDYCGSWAGLPLGDEASRGDNTVGCRIYHATVAATQTPEVHCIHAGPTGGDVCGSWCENYCHLAQRNCTGLSELYVDEAACLSACATFPNNADVDSDTGDSVQCRIRYAGLAGTEAGAEVENCKFAAADGGEKCIDNATCENYCTLVSDACTGDNDQYTDFACLPYCNTASKMPKGSVGVEAGNSVACRIYHATAASAGNTELHCPHAGPSGGDVCGSWCDVYCQLAQDNCKGENVLYPDQAECRLACAEMDISGDANDLEGDSVQCRITYAGRAGISGDQSAITQCGKAALWSPDCRQPMPQSCATAGETPTTDGCVTCAEAVKESREAIAELRDLYLACTSNAECELVLQSTGCAADCETAVNTELSDAFEDGVDQISAQHCQGFGTGTGQCTRATSTCLPALAICDSGKCKAVAQ